jgi:hypothetical protein
LPRNIQAKNQGKYCWQLSLFIVFNTTFALLNTKQVSKKNFISLKRERILSVDTLLPENASQPYFPSILLELVH